MVSITCQPCMKEVASIPSSDGTDDNVIQLVRIASHAVKDHCLAVHSGTKVSVFVATNPVIIVSDRDAMLAESVKNAYEYGYEAR